ncbi:CdaR family protein [Fodinibius saliphilus]|uniref:CdaR family protein n=1 Tax=Fodinibius saliphilus TaxID=1920650 RepID=UPI001109ECCA|nr:CdaR family protein [Fodinibius saliphilus]
MSRFEEYKEKFLSGWWEDFVKKSDEEAELEIGRERIVVFAVALILAFCFWLMVNLSRDYNLNVELPISLGAVPENKALAEDLPDKATVSVSGEGWKLINLYNNPPSINVDVTNEEVNVYDQVQQRMNTLPDISVQKVQPLVLTVELEESASKKVPVLSRVNVSFDKQYDFIEQPVITPDSITITGARSLLDDITAWPTDSVDISGVSTDLSRSVQLKEASKLVNLSRQQVEFNGTVSQFTEGEMEVDVSARDLPLGRSISFSPSSITVTYRVPIGEYNDVQKINPFTAYITDRQIKQDSSGFITPKIEQTENKYHIKIRSFQPRSIAYFMVLD